MKANLKDPYPRVGSKFKLSKMTKDSIYSGVCVSGTTKLFAILNYLRSGVNSNI